jgi:hypothetical protein
MLHLTASLTVCDMPDPPRPSVAYPPSWVVLITPALAGGLLSSFDFEHALTVNCGRLDSLAEFLLAVGSPQMAIETANFRRMYTYEFTFAIGGTGNWERTHAVVSLNSAADCGNEPEALKQILAWMRESIRAAAPGSRSLERLMLWSEPPPRAPW